MIGLGAQPPAPLRIRPQETGRPRRAVAAQDVDGFQQGLGHGRRLDVEHAQHSRRVAPETAVAPQDVIQRVRRDRVRERGSPGDQVSETLPSGSVRDHRVERLAGVPRADQRPPELGECPERLADRGRLVAELRFAGARGFAIRSAADPVVGLHHRVGDERLPLDGADRENREAVVRELAESVGEVALPLPAQPRDPMWRGVAEEAFRNREAPEVLEGGPAAGWRRPNCCPARTAGATRTASRRRRASLRADARGRAAARAALARRCGPRSGVPRRRARRRRAARSSSWPAGWSACDGRPRRTSGPGPRSTAPAALLREAPRRAHAPRRPRRTGIRTGGAAPKDARAGSRTAPRSRRAPPRPDGAGVR